MKKMTSLLTVLATALTMMGCGGGDDPVTPVVVGSAPKVVETTPANGATGVELGDINIKVTFDQPVNISGSIASKVTVSADNGDNLAVKNIVKSGNALLLPVTCNRQNTVITVSVAAGAVTNASGLANAAYTFSFTTYVAPQAPDDGHLTASAAVSQMTAGWNLGNTLDAWNSNLGNNNSPELYETCWGQPVTTAGLFEMFRAKGFTAIRVPVTWMQHLDSNNNVDAAWMNRVQEIVDMVINSGMYCILNVHHDTGASAAAWLKADNATVDITLPKFQTLWTQIATRFKDYSDHLLFEGYNEMLYGSDTNAQWSQPQNLNNLQAINKYAQAFVDAVRATGGNNEYRNLIVTTYSASHGDQTLSGFVVPTDPCGNQNHLAVEVHSYDPYDWVNTYNMTWTSECSAAVTSMFNRLNTYFFSKGYPVIVGEYGTNGADEKTINKSSTAEQKAQAAKQAAEITRLCKQYGGAGFYWMGLVEGQDRANLQWSMEEVADAIVEAAR